MKEKYTTEKKGDEVVFSLAKNNDRYEVTVSWRGMTAEVTAAYEDTVVFAHGIKLQNKSVNGFRLSSEDVEGVKKIFDAAEQKNKEIEKIKREELQKEIQEVKQGKVTLQWRQGSPLSGWVADSKSDASVLREAGLTSDIGGWGEKIKNKIQDFDSFKTIENGERATVEYADIQEMLKQEEEEAEKRVEEQEQERQAVIKKAKETGEKQLLQKYAVDCTDRNEECDLDMIYVYVDGEGKETSEKIHTH